MFVVEMEYRNSGNSIEETIENPNFEQVEVCLNQLESGGVEFIRLSNELSASKPLIEMEIIGKSNFYLISVFFDSNKIVFLYNESVSSEERVEILGNMWPRSLVCEDLVQLKEVCKCFYETGGLANAYTWKVKKMDK